MIVIGENATEGQPTLAYCAQYAKQHGIPPQKVFIDWGNQYGGWETLFTYINPYLEGDTISLPWDAVLSGKNMMYMYTSGSASNDYQSVDEAIDVLLNP